MAKKKKDEVNEAVEPEAIETPAEETISELDTLKAELDAQKDLLLRTAAEFDNYKRRTEKERVQLSEYVKANTIKALLPTLDNIDRAVNVSPDTPEYAKGIEMIVKQLREAVAGLGLAEIEAEGAPFDPELHEAVMHIEDESMEENVVAEVLQKGYKVGDTVIRPAMVKVAN